MEATGVAWRERVRSSGGKPRCSERGGGDPEPLCN
jgi:hypothetical protein